MKAHTYPAPIPPQAGAAVERIKIRVVRADAEPERVVLRVVRQAPETKSVMRATTRPPRNTANSDGPDIRTRVTAVHEAGHALAALQVRRRIHRATIVPGANTGGDVQLEFSARWVLSKRYLLDSVFVLMAGEGAARAFFHASDTTHARSSTIDRQFARELLGRHAVPDGPRGAVRKIDPSEHDAIIAAQLQRATKWAQRILVWAAIDRVASALIERSTLDRAAIREVSGW